MARTTEPATRNGELTRNSPALGDGHNGDSGKFHLRWLRHGFAPLRESETYGIAAPAAAADIAQFFGDNMGLARPGVAARFPHSRSYTAFDATPLRDQPRPGITLHRLG